MDRDVQQRPLDANGHGVHNLGRPQAANDATYTDNVTVPAPCAPVGLAGASLLAAAADHVHPSPVPLRVVASGTATIASGARATLAEVARSANEVFCPAHVFLSDNEARASWGGVGNLSQIVVYYEGAEHPNKVSIVAVNDAPTALTIEWAVVALTARQ